MSTKICTSIEQSKKLIELGIDVNTADMFYCNGHISVLQSSDFITVNSRMREIYPEAENYIPAWSLSALLDILTEQDFIIKTIGNKFNIDIPIRHWKIWFSSLLDAAFEMIVWLKENGKL